MLYPPRESPPPLILLLCAFPAQAQLPPGQKAMAVRLVPETSRPAPGSKVTLALVMSPRPGWHGYWQNPGDAGVGTRIAWRLPSGATAGPIRFPVPERLIIQGLMNYVFEGEHALLVDLQLPTGHAPGTRLPVRGKVDYLVCTDRICVPESTELAAELEVGNARGAAAPGFDRYRQALPEGGGSSGAADCSGSQSAARRGRGRRSYFYRSPNGPWYSAPQSVSRRGDW